MLVADRNVVTDLHCRIMRFVGEAESSYGDFDLRLEGGTALAAYHLHHRESEDLDFFAGVQIDIRDWLRFLEPRLIESGFTIKPEREAIPSFATLYVSNVSDPERPPIKIQFARTSPYKLAPLDVTAEGIRIGSQRDLFRGKLEAVCGRTEPRDFIDLYHILWRNGEDGLLPEIAVVRERFRSLLADLMECDPGMVVSFVSQQIAEAREKMPMVSRFPLRLLKPATDDNILQAIEVCVEECAKIIRDDLTREM